MKNKLVTIIFLCAIGSAVANEGNTWTKKADFKSPREGAISFTIGNVAYVGTGSNKAPMTDIWAYDPVLNSWTQKSNFAGPARFGAVAFSIGKKGYVGTGYDNKNYYNDFWEYDPSSNMWTKKSDFKGESRYNAVAFSINNHGYIGTGMGSTYYNDFWEYNQENDSWSQKSNFSGSPRSSAVAFSNKTKAYVGTGYDGKNCNNDFWEYNPIKDSWTEKASFPGGVRQGAVAFNLGAEGFVGTGFNGKEYKQDLWMYIPAYNQWRVRSNVNGEPRSGGIGFSLANHGYVGLGSSKYGLNDFYMYTTYAAVDLTLLIEGYYDSQTGKMRPCYYTTGNTLNNQIADVVTIYLYGTAGYNNGSGVVAFISGCELTIDGATFAEFTGVSPGGDYYIRVTHRNTIEVWSSSYMQIDDPTPYDFTSSASQALCDNEVSTPMGYAMISGDINQDGSVDGSDFLILDVDIQTPNAGYIPSDLSGDGASDGDDFLIWDPNNQNGAGQCRP